MPPALPGDGYPIVQHGQGAGSALQQRVHAHEVADHLDTKVCVTYAARGRQGDSTLDVEADGNRRLQSQQPDCQV